MDWTYLNLLPLLVAVVLLFTAFRAQERFWQLGFMGWRKVYAGLGFYLLSGLLSGAWYWMFKTSPASSALSALQTGIIVTGAIGIGLVLAGSIERLRELSAERSRLEDIRAGFDLFDSLREIAAQPYAFLEVLDYALKELVRAAGVDSGGLWLFHPAKSEWVLTGWANMSEKLRQQTESVRGSGTGFDRLAAAHKARLFAGPEKTRLFFPEWEAEGFQSILGLPLVSGKVGSPGRQVLGAIILADQSPTCFDDDRARRLFAASDYVAAVIAEARITRQLDAARHQLDDLHAELAREREAMRQQAQQDAEHLETVKAAWEEEKRALEQAGNERLQEANTRAREELNRIRAEFERNLAVETERAAQMRQRWEEARCSSEQLENRLAEERTNWETRLDQLHRDWQAEREEHRRREQELTTEHEQLLVSSGARIAELEQNLNSERGLVARYRADLEERDRLLQQREDELSAARQAHEDESRKHTTELEALRSEMATLADRLNKEQGLAAKHWEALQEQIRTTADLEARIQAERHDSAETISGLRERLETMRATAAEEQQRAAGELQSVRLLLREREDELAGNNEQLAQLRMALQDERERAATERQQAAASLDALEGELREERTRRESIEREIDALRSEWFEKQTQQERMIVEERLEHRRRVHVFETRRTQFEEQVREVLAVPTAAGKISRAMRRLADTLPPSVELYLWQRVWQDRPRMLAWIDLRGRVLAGEPLSAWPFESHTILAEGITKLTALSRWLLARSELRADLAAQWDRHWGDDRSPVWAVTWPWLQGDDFSGGWVTAFGFDDGPVTDEQIKEADSWVRLIAALACGMDAADWTALPRLERPAVPHEAAPLPGSDSPSGNGVDDVNGTESEPDGGSDPSDLHHVIIDWAAAQAEDAMSLNLNAHPALYGVNGHWLRGILERGRTTCRRHGQDKAEFTVSTMRENGHTVLRMVCLDESPGSGEADTALINDDELTDMPGADSSPDEHGVPGQLVSGHWLVHDGACVGMELRFAAPTDMPSKEETGGDAVPSAPAAGTILVIDEHQSMGDLLSGMLESLGYGVVRPDSPAGGPGSVGERTIDLAVIDATVGGDEGWESARRFRDVWRDTPSLLVVSAGSVDVPEDIAFLPTLQVPFQIEELKACLDTIGSADRRHTIEIESG